MKTASALVFEEKWKMEFRCHLRKRVVYHFLQKAIDRVWSVQLPYKTQSCVVGNTCQSAT